MDTFVVALRSALRLSCATALLAVLSVAQSQSQTQPRSIRAVPQPVAPAPSAAAAPAGLASPIPNPAGLTSRFPAGLPPLAGGGGRATPPATDAGPLPDSSVPPQTNAMGGPGYANTLGAPGYGGAVAGAPAQAAAARTGPYTALQAAQSFLAADGNRDGELTRAEAGRLTIAPYAFEEMDRNHDGILTRFEYEDALR